MKTYRITEKEIEGMKPVAVGYKMFNNDFTTAHGDYDYKDENGSVVGTIHKVDGDIEECRWGLHFSKLPHDCFNFYSPVQWNKFAKVEAYGKLIEGDKKCVASILKIVGVYTFDEFVRLCQDELQKAANAKIEGGNYISGGNDIRGGNGICGGNDIRGGNAISGGNGICGGNAISGGNDIRGGNGICGGNGIRGGNAISGGNGICGGNAISGGNDIRGGNGICGGNYIRGGNAISGGNDIRGGNGICGGNYIRGGNGIWGSRNCEGVSRCIFCYGIEGGRLLAFNKPITEERFEEIKERLNSFDWYPVFNNAYQLKGDLEWYETNIPAIVSVDNKTAWSFMPQEMIEYIQNLPEYDEEIFDQIIGEL